MFYIIFKCDVWATNCRWLCGNDGEFLNCNIDEFAKGQCGSGGLTADCGSVGSGCFGFFGQWSALECCTYQLEYRP